AAPGEAGGDHLERVGGRAVVQFLHVTGDDERGDGAFGVGGAERPVDQVGQLLGHHDRLAEVGGDVLVQAREVHFLLVGAAHGAAVGLPDQRHHRHVVQLGVVQPVQQVDGAGAGGGRAHAGLAGELRVADGL